MKNDNVQYVIAGWLALAFAIGYFFPTIPFLFLSSSESTDSFFQISSIIPSLIFTYLFITFEKLLKNKYKINTVTRFINLITIIYIISTILMLCLNIFFTYSFVEQQIPPEASLLLVGYLACRVTLGLALIVFGVALWFNSKKVNSNMLKAFTIIMIISGVLYIQSGLPALSGLSEKSSLYQIRIYKFSGIQDLFIAIIFSLLFFRTIKR